MTNLQRRLTQALQVANSWSSDLPGHGLPLLSLGTTRRLHSEDHRTKALSEIDAKLAWNRSWTGTTDDVNVPSHDIPALTALRKLVQDATIGVEWQSDTQNMSFHDKLYRAGELD